jgi:hypothetical protein
MVTSIYTPQFDVGDGSDGELVFDGHATVLGVEPAGPEDGPWTYTLTQSDVRATAITVDADVAVLVPSGCKIRSQQPIRGAGGVISADGAGQAGGVATATDGGAGTDATACLAGPAGDGGAAGGDSAGAAGTAGTLTAPTAGSVHDFSFALFGLLVTATNGVSQPEGAPGGGAGAGDGTKTGGDGGPGGGELFVCAPALVGTLAITARGASGKAAQASGNGGGGGGGGGGHITLAISHDIGTNVVTDVSGGSAGAKQGTGTVGTAGTAGTVDVLGPCQV